MLATPAPSLAETRDNTSFAALLWALSRPGVPRTLPEPGEAPIIAALLDRECRTYCTDPLLIPEILRAGAELVDIAEADHVFMGTMTTSDALDQVVVGTDLYPDEGATVILRARFGQGPALRLTGPGIDGALRVQIDGLPARFWAARTSRLRYPMGFDLFLVDKAQVIGLPRSTTVEEL